MNRREDVDARADVAPERLIDQASEAARLLAEANQQYGRGLDEQKAWRALQARRAGRQWRPFLMPTGVGLAIAAAVLLLLARRNQHGPIQPAPVAQQARPLPAPVIPERPAETAPAREPESAGEERSVARVNRPKASPARRALNVGRSVLPDGSEINLAPRAVAAVRGRPDRGTTIELTSGEIDLKVAPQRESTFEVAAANITFRVIGTRFHVSLRDQQPELEVSEGTVAVVDGAHIVARVTAGGHWSAAAPMATEERPAPPRPAQPPAPAEQPRPSPASSAEHCLAIARQGQGRQAVECLRPISLGSGLSAEMAIYEIARLQRDVLGDASAALATLQTYTTRFPRGALQVEAQLSRIDLLARLGRTQEALAESGRLLSAASGRERAADLHLLRGNLLRERLADCERAIQEYAAAEIDRGATGAEATLGRARCLETQGRKVEAAAAYRACVERHHGRTAAEARRRLEAIDQ